MNPIFLFLRTYWLQIAISVLILGLVGAFKIQTARLGHAQDRIISLQASVDRFEAISAEQKAENDRIQKGSEVATQVTVKSYEAKLKARDNYYENHPNNIITELHDGGVLPSPSDTSSGTQDSVPNTSTGADAIPSNRVLTEEDCTTTTIMLESLQGWVTDQQKNWNQ